MKCSDAAAAYHEAGHAVAAFFNNLRIVRATLHRTKSEASCVETVLSLRHDRPDLVVTDHVRAKIEREAMVCFAGKLAQRMYATRSVRSWQNRHDYHVAADLLSYCGSEGEILRAHVRYLEARVSAALRTSRYRVSLNAVAEALLEHGAMRGSQIVAVIQASHQRAVRPVEEKGANEIVIIGDDTDV